MLDRRRQHPIDVLRTKIYVVAATRRWHSLSNRGLGHLRSANRPLQDRLFERYEKGLHVPRDCPGGFIDRMEEAVPGSASLFRSLVWPILKGLPPEASVLRERLGQHETNCNNPGALVRSFADLETLLMQVELEKADGRHQAFAQAVTCLEEALPNIRFIADVEPEAEEFSLFLKARLLGWQVSVKERQAKGLVAPLSGFEAAQNTEKSESDSFYIARSGSAWKYASIASGFLLIAAATPSQFSQAAAMLMFATFAVCASAEAKKRPQTPSA